MIGPFIIHNYLILIWRLKIILVNVNLPYYDCSLEIMKTKIIQSATISLILKYIDDEIVTFLRSFRPFLIIFKTFYLSPKHMWSLIKLLHLTLFYIFFILFIYFINTFSIYYPQNP